MEKKLSNLITKEDVIEILSSSEEELEINKTHEKLRNEKITIGNVGTTTTRTENIKGKIVIIVTRKKGKCN